MTPRESFDSIAERLAEVVDDAISTVPRERRRRVELIQRTIRRALAIGFKAARKVDIPADEEGR
jgi:hypothetical protein